jgi:predicted nucleic acid-binding protein
VRIVIDASVALKWVLNEHDSEAALALREHELLAPDLWLAEAANALWRSERMGLLTLGEAHGLLTDLSNSPIASFPMARHLEQALTLAIQLRHPIYDCIYLALAVHHDIHVVTADQRFAGVAGRPGMTDRVRLLGT